VPVFCGGQRTRSMPALNLQSDPMLVSEKADTIVLYSTAPGKSTDYEIFNS